MIHKFTLAIACLIAVSLLGDTSFAQTSQGSLSNPLFSQFTTQGGASSATAGAYPAPHYVPQNVGASYYTYQPLMPHEHMYVHSRNYFNYYNDSSFFGGDGSLNITSVRWQNGNSGLAPFPFSTQRVQQLQYKLAERVYGINGCVGGNCALGGGGLGLGGGGGLGLGGGGLGGGGFGLGGGLGGHLSGRQLLGAGRIAGRLAR